LGTPRITASAEGPRGSAGKLTRRADSQAWCVIGVTDHGAIRRYSWIGFPEIRERAGSKSPAEINRPIP